MEPDAGAALVNIEHALILLGSLAALIATPYWLTFSKLAGCLLDPDGWKGRQALGHASLLTGIALGLSGAGYLSGRYFGGF